MRGFVLIAALAAAAGPALGQAQEDHSAHAGHAMPMPMPMPTPMAPAPADPHAGHHMPAPAPGGEPPATPADHAAERFHDPGVMAAARAQLAREHGGGTAWKVMLSTAEVREDDGAAWEGEAWWGNDDRRLVLKTEGEGEGGDLHEGEVQALWSRPVGPYFDLQAGVRQDFGEGPDRTHAVLGFEGLAPYWFEVEAAAFLSDRGDLTARLAGSYDLRLTQKLILEPRAEANFASGGTDLEAGLRLRYEVRREFAPYVGVHADEDDTRFVMGLRAWF